MPSIFIRLFKSKVATNSFWIIGEQMFQMVVSFLFAYIVGGALLFLILAAIVRKKAPDQWHTNAEDDYVPYADQKNTDSNEHE